MPTVFGGAGLGVFEITAGTKIPATIPGTTKIIRGSGIVWCRSSPDGICIPLHPYIHDLHTIFTVTVIYVNVTFPIGTEVAASVTGVTGVRHEWRVSLACELTAK
jgi:hypothetical protein